MNGLPFRNSQSHELIDDAWTRTSTSLSAGVGFGISLISMKSGDPYLLKTFAFICRLQNHTVRPCIAPELLESPQTNRLSGRHAANAGTCNDGVEFAV